MKASIFAVTLLFNATVFAQASSDLKSISLCTANGNYEVSVSEDGADLLMKTFAKDEVQTSSSEIMNTLVATPKDLADIEANAKLKEKLTAATTYDHRFGEDIIAKDATGKKYHLQKTGTTITLVSTTDSCK